MPKLPSLTPNRIAKLLKYSGLMLDRVRVSHHVYYNPQTKRRVVISFHKRELPKGTLLEILKRAGVAKEEMEVLP